jgi:hypothetical protein
MLRFLASIFKLEILICFRDVVEFAVSFYCQSVRNPPVHPCYGRDLSLGEMLEEEWFRKHLDYVGFLMEVRHALGDVTIRTFSYSDTVISEILQYLGGGELECGIARLNGSYRLVDRPPPLNGYGIGRGARVARESHNETPGDHHLARAKNHRLLFLKRVYRNNV